MTPTAALQTALANRLRSRVGVRVSPFFALTWREVTMPREGSILRAWVRPRFKVGGKVGAWGTPSAQLRPNDKSPELIEDYARKYLARTRQRWTYGNQIANQLIRFHRGGPEVPWIANTEHLRWLMGYPAGWTPGKAET